MPATNDSTFDLDPPRRPALAELGGATKQNHPKKPPDPATQPTAEEWNHFTKLLEKLAAIVPIARLYVKITAGTPAVFNVVTMRADMLAADFTVIDNGVGDTTVRWTTGVGGKLPTASQAPRLTVVSDTPIDEARAFYTTSAGNPAVRVKTLFGGVATDCDFAVDIY